jgi:RND family efflux transporter MFP subunit
MKTIFKRTAFLAAACLLTFWLLASCSSKHESKRDEYSEQSSQSTDSVRVESVRELLPETAIVLPGDLKPWEQTTLYPKVKGFVKHLAVDRGSLVKHGQVLAVLDAPELQEQLSESVAKLEEYRARFDQSKAVFARLLQTSQTSGAVAAGELEAAKSRVAADSASVASMRSAVQAKRDIVGYLTITAPFDGMITERNISQGALVGPDDVAKSRPMFVLENNRTLRLTVAVPEQYSSELAAKAAVEFTVSALPEKVFTAKLSRSSGTLEQNIRAMMAEFDVLNPSGTLKAGMYADVKLPVKRQAATLFVPTSAIVNSTERTFVIAVRDGKAEWVNVKKGITLDSLTEVFGNLTVTDAVIKKASEEIRNGKAVTAAR